MQIRVILFLLTAVLIAANGVANGQALPSATCGNKLLDADETCARCPADCTVQPCQPGNQRVKFDVIFAPPETPDVSAASLLIGYRSDRLSLPGKGMEQTVKSRLTTPNHDVMAFNDVDFALRIVAGHPKTIPGGTLATIEFDRCEGAPAPTVADLSCAVESCAGSTGPADGCRCSITATEQ